MFKYIEACDSKSVISQILQVYNIAGSFIQVPQ